MSRKVDHLATAGPLIAIRREHVPLLVLLAGVAVVLTALGPAVWLVILTDGLLAVGVVLAASGWGAWPIVWLGLGRRQRLQQFCVATALGLGLLAALILAFGVSGALSRFTAWCLLGVGWVLGLARLFALQKQTLPGQTRALAGNANIVAASVLLLTLVVPLAVALFGASLPPRVLWMGENFAYDVLEYHLQCPREYLDAERVHFLAHNVYASFPQQMEMLYLLLMHLGGGPLAGAIPAQLLHTLCGVLAVLALTAWTPRGWPRIVVAVVGGSVPWLTYLGCLAYVELGALLFAAVAGGLVLDHLQSDGVDAKRGANNAAAGPRTGRAPASEAPCDWRTTLAAGLCAGLASGCKYTALALVVAALPVAWLCTMRGSAGTRAKQLVIFTGGALVAFSPWLIRNSAFSGNPVYPFGYRWFGGVAWSAQQDQQWARGHRLPEEEDSLGGRLRTVWDELLASRMFGPAVFLVALGGLVRARSRPAVMLAIWLVLIAAIWATLTHMPGRFVVPALIPLALLAGLVVRGRREAATSASRPTSPRHLLATLLLAGVVVMGALANNFKLVGLLREHDAWWERLGLPLRELLGATDVLAQAEPLNRIVPADGKAWVVGEARAFYVQPEACYTVVFNRDPWLAYARDATPEQALDWLRTQNVSHVVFSWSEIDRLRDTYGFPEFVTRGWVEARRLAGLRRVDLPEEAEGLDVEILEVLPK